MNARKTESEIRFSFPDTGDAERLCRFLDAAWSHVRDLQRTSGIRLAHFFLRIPHDDWDALCRMTVEGAVNPVDALTSQLYGVTVEPTEGPVFELVVRLEGP